MTGPEAHALRAAQPGSDGRLDLIDVLRSLQHDIAAMLEARICFFGQYDPEAQAISIVWQVHDGVEVPGGRFPLGSGLTSQVIRDRQPRLIRRWSREGPRIQVQYATVQPDLPESAITVPVVLGERILGVLSVQNHLAEAFEPSDLEFVQGIAERYAPAIAAADPESMARDHDAALTLDGQGRLVGMTQAARTLLGLEEHSIIFGFPIARPQGGNWPLGSAALTDALRPIIERLERGDTTPEVRIPVRGDVERTVTCKASVVVDEGRRVGTVMIFSASNSRAA